MTGKSDVSGTTEVALEVTEPYDFHLSMQVIRSFQPEFSASEDILRMAVRIDGTPVLIEFSHNLAAKGTVLVSARPGGDEESLRDTARWVLFADLDLTPFYRLAEKNQKMKKIVNNLHGIKPTRPAVLFEMAVTAIIEQQISLAAANRIRARLEERFGEPVEDLFVFPGPDDLGTLPDEDLRSCGLSRQKIRYTRELATGIISGKINLETLKTMSDNEVRETIMTWKGFGRWSADYILIRGLARPDAVPVDDLAIRSVTGAYLGNGQRLSPDEVTEVLEPFRPYRGLTAFYLLAAQRQKIEV